MACLHREPGQEAELSGLASGGYEEEGGELQALCRVRGGWASASMCLILGVPAYFLADPIQDSSWCL